ncbi:MULTISPECIES: hybrid sensor histidine kinase/response regulator [unclassified Duganella]|uniref:hybrid sensor histidine kinase/response regulator n=1 Tax=unclassified Duganella TaxID=2636909 RepID=UPI0015873CDB|nr:MULTISPECIES: hybrid sensor histidine kinase/response regulator [unclassified Duganella]
MRDFLSLLAGATALALALILPAGATPTPWQKLAPTMFEHLVPAERGFPSPIVMTVAQDGDGFIWFGTQSGLGRWDGYRMRNFFYKADDPHSLPGDFVQTLHVDRQGRLWIGTTTDGVAMYDKRSERFIRYPAGPKGLSSPAVSSLASDERGNIWVGSAGGLDYIDLQKGGAITHYPRAASAMGGARANQVRALLVDRAGHLWIGSNAGLARRDAVTGMIEDLPMANGLNDAVLSLGSSSAGEVVFGTLKSGIGVAHAGDSARLLPLSQIKDASSAMVLSIAEILPGTWWAATYGGGVIEFDTAGHSRRIVHRAAMSISLAHDRTAAVLRDRSGLIWVANERGVDIHNPANRNVDTVLDGAGLSEISAFAFMTDTGGRLWVALGDQGIDLIDADGNRSAGLRPDPGKPDDALPNRLILSLAEAEPHEAWIGTALGLYHTSERGQRVRRVALPLDDPYPRIGSIVQLGETLWLSLPSGLMRYNLRSHAVRIYEQGPPAEGGLSDSRVTIMRVGPDGMLWLGTRHGLNRFDPATGQIEHILSSSDRANALPHSVITSLTFDQQHRLWVGTNSNGIGIMDGRNADGSYRFRKLRMQEGLPVNNIGALQADQAGNVWASTSDGIAVIDASTFKVHTLDRSSGLVFQPYFVGAVGKTAHHEIVFGTSGGYVVVQPVLPQTWRYQPPLVVSSVRLDSQLVPPAALLTAGGPALEIAPGTRKVEVEIAALDYSSSQRNRYAFRLDGYDKDWVEADASHRATTYANVPPGSYRLSMRGSNRNGVWSPHELSMELHFLPAWYQTWWARLGAVLTVLACAWGVYRWRVRNLQQQVYSRTLHLERVHAIVKSINDELDFDTLLHTILRESSAIGEVGVAYALIAEVPDGPLAIRAAWGHDALPSAAAGMAPAAAQAQFVDAATVIAPDMFLKQSTMLAVRIRVNQQVQGYLVFKQGAPFARKDLEMFKALKEPFVSAFQKASAIRAIQRARADAEASTRAKSEFLANISHEIRTPMNAILGFAGLGTHLDLPAKPHDYFTKIGRAGQNLLSIIDDVLDFAKIESGKLELEAVPFDLGETLAQISDLFSWRAAEKGLDLLAWAEPQVPLRLVGDPLRLNQVLVNLVGNALKFTADGHIGLRVELVEDGQPVRLRFIVEDSGVGISAEQQARLFRAFSQADTSTTRLYGGTGLGLAISQQLVQAMGGVIGIDSTPGLGSRFHFDLALHRQPGEQPAPPALPAEAAGQRILVVDDSAMVRDMLCRLLRHNGFEVAAAASGAAAMAHLATQAADLVLLDGELEGVDTGLPLVLMKTEFSREPAAQATPRTGVAATLVKPVQPAQLLDAVLVGLGLASPPRPEVAASTALSDAAQRISGARVLVVDDNVINQQVAREVLLRAGVQADLAGSGVEALQMVDQASYDAVLMDIQMPGMDGYETTTRIRAKTQHAALPLIAMTAHAVAGFRDSSLVMGMNDYVTKPIDPERLFSVLASQLRRPRPAATATAPAMPAQATTQDDGMPALPGIDMHAALGRLGGNSKLLSVLLGHFASDFEASAAQMLHAIEQHDFPQAAMLVHKVRGAAGNLSMPELHRTATELEELLASSPGAPIDAALAAFSTALDTVLDGLQAQETQA